VTELLFPALLVVDGVLAGTVYALVALAFVVVYKASRMVNFALGEWVMVASRLVAASLHVTGLPVVGAVAVGCAGMAALAVAVSRVVLQPLAGQPLVSLIMVSIGLGILLRGATPLVFRGIPGTIPLGLQDAEVEVLGLPVAADRLAAAAVALCAIALLGWFFQRSRTGLALRAIACDQHAAATVGISLRRHVTITWALAGVLSVLAGTLWTAVSGGGFGVEVLGLKVFPIVIMGGLDSIAGTIVAAVVVGVLENLVAGYLDPLVGGGLSRVAAYVVLLVALFVRPHGLLGRPEVRRV
jgi:branched-chain amino acid transport system permease protein